MDLIKSLFPSRKDTEGEYEPLAGDPDVLDEPEGSARHHEEVPFSWLEYSIFALIGVAMLWAW